MKKEFWNDSVVVITGASSGIGKALLEELVMYPCQLVLLARRAGDIAEPETKHKDCVLHRVTCDLSDPSSVQDAIEWTMKRVDRVDVLFNNAGITAHGRFDSLTMEVYQKTFATNFLVPSNSSEVCFLLF